MTNDQPDAVAHERVDVPFVVRPVRRPAVRTDLAEQAGARSAHSKADGIEGSVSASKDGAEADTRGTGDRARAGSPMRSGRRGRAGRRTAPIAGIEQGTGRSAALDAALGEEPVAGSGTHSGAEQRVESGAEPGAGLRRDEAAAQPEPPSDGVDARSEPSSDGADDWAPFGPLAPFVARPGVTDVFVNGTGGLWFDDGHGLQHDDAWWCDERGLRDLATRLVALGGRHVDEATPCVDVRLRGGMRVHAVLPPISTEGTLLSIRIPRKRSFRFDELADAGMLVPWQSDRLRAAIASRENLLVAGPAGSGKTTLLSALLAEAPVDERLVCIEDVAELRVQHPHVVSLEARQPNLEGAGEVGLARLVREALRMRPDRVIVGECRGSEVRELLSALNTGHDGGAGTLHANSLDDVPARLEALGALAGMPMEAIARQTVSAIGLVVQLERVAGVRRVAQLGRFGVDAAGRLVIVAEGAVQARPEGDSPKRAAGSATC